MGTVEGDDGMQGRDTLVSDAQGVKVLLVRTTRQRGHEVHVTLARDPLTEPDTAAQVQPGDHARREGVEEGLANRVDGCGEAHACRDMGP